MQMLAKAIIKKLFFFCLDSYDNMLNVSLHFTKKQTLKYIYKIWLEAHFKLIHTVFAEAM